MLFSDVVANLVDVVLSKCLKLVGYAARVAFVFAVTSARLTQNI